MHASTSSFSILNDATQVSKVKGVGQDRGKEEGQTWTPKVILVGYHLLN